MAEVAPAFFFSDDITLQTLAEQTGTYPEPRWTQTSV